MIAGEVLADGQKQEMVAGEQFDDGLKRKKVVGELFADGLNQKRLPANGSPTGWLIVAGAECRWFRCHRRG